MNSELQYIAAEDISFYVNESGLIMAEYKGENIGRVAVLRMFPFEFEEEYLCVRRENYQRADKEEEIGIIRSFDEFEEEQALLIRSELKKRYFVPDILDVIDVTEELGYTMWKVKTTAGETEFSVTDMSSNVINLGKNRIMLVDVYGNRFYIPDVTKVDDKTLKIIEIWI